MYRYLLALVGIWLFLASQAKADWTAFSTIEKAPDGKSYKETVFLVNDNSKAVTLHFPNFQFPGHGDIPAESIGPMGDITLAPSEAVRFIHRIPIDRKDGFATSIGIQDIKDDIPITQHILNGKDDSIKRPPIKMSFDQE